MRQKVSGREGIFLFVHQYLRSCLKLPIPEKVSVNEAVELAKKFGGNESPAFVNGVLAKFIPKEGAKEEAEPAKEEIEAKEEIKAKEETEEAKETVKEEKKEQE